MLGKVLRTSPPGILTQDYLHGGIPPQALLEVKEIHFSFGPLDELIKHDFALLKSKNSGSSRIKFGLKDFPDHRPICVDILFHRRRLIQASSAVTALGWGANGTTVQVKISEGLGWKRLGQHNELNKVDVKLTQNEACAKRVGEKDVDEVDSLRYSSDCFKVDSGRKSCMVSCF